MTFYAAADNDPPGSAEIAYPNSRHVSAGGTGTYADPLSLATDPREIRPGVLVYYPPVQKYFVMEDDCAECIDDWSASRTPHVDLWMSNTADPAVQNCEAALTPDDPDTIIVNPPAEPARRPEAALRRREVLAQHGWLTPHARGRPGVPIQRRGGTPVGGNKIVVYKEPGVVAVEDHDAPKLEVPAEVAEAMGMSRKADHGVILRNVSTNICGSDQHMVRGRTTAPAGQTLGHEITGEIVEKGSDVQFLEVGDICSVPFNIACGRCRNCREGQTGICLNVNPARAGSAYGYVDMGGWEGGQAEYVMVPFADFNLLKFPDRDQALEKILDLTMLSDIFPTGYHGAYTAGRHHGIDGVRGRRGPGGAGCGVLVVAAGRGGGDRRATSTPTGWRRRARSAARPSTSRRTRRSRTRSRRSSAQRGRLRRGRRRVRGDAGTARAAARHPAAVLNSIMALTRAGGRLGIPGLYVTGDPGAADADAKEGTLKVRLGLGWAKSHSFATGQCPVLKYNRGLMMSILHDKAHIADAVNATVIGLDDAPRGYQEFDQGRRRSTSSTRTG